MAKIIPGAYLEEQNFAKWIKGTLSGLSLVFIRRIAALARDLNIVITFSSGYRDNEWQTRLYEADLKANGGKQSGRVARPGTSWHETGCALDLSGDYLKNLSMTIWMKIAQGDLKHPLTKYGLILPLNMIDKKAGPWEWWHIQPIETKGVPSAMRMKFLTDDKIYYVVKPVNEKQTKEINTEHVNIITNLQKGGVINSPAVWIRTLDGELELNTSNLKLLLMNVIEKYDKRTIEQKLIDDCKDIGILVSHELWISILNGETKCSADNLEALFKNINKLIK